MFDGLGREGCESLGFLQIIETDADMETKEPTSRGTYGSNIRDPTTVSDLYSWTSSDGETKRFGCMQASILVEGNGCSGA